MAKEGLRKFFTPKKAAQAKRGAKPATAPIIQEDDSFREDSCGDEVEIKIYDKDDENNQEGSSVGGSYTEVVSLALMGDSHLDPIKASLGSAADPRKTSFGSAGDPLKASICSDVTDYDNLYCPGATAERDEHYMRNVYGLSESDIIDTKMPMYCSPLSTNLGKTTDSWKTSSFKSNRGGAGVTASFGSFKSDRGGTEGTAVPSFGSTATDFDNLTSLGAQAEQDENYLRQCGLTAVLEGSAPLTSTNAELTASPPLVPSFPFVATPMTFDSLSPQTSYENQQLSAAQLSAQAASLDFAAAQLREYARQAEEAAIRARTQVSNSVDPHISMEARVAAGKSLPSANRGTSRMWSSAEKSTTEGNTTLMLKNVPNDYNRDMLLEMLDENGFRGRYNFVYLPMDFKRWSGLGYAFVNMVTHEDGVELMEKFDGFDGWKKQSTKVCQVAWGDQGQGLDAHIQRYRNSPVMHPDWPEEARPLLFVDGEQVDFPPPTKKLKPPRVKR